MIPCCSTTIDGRACLPTTGFTVNVPALPGCVTFGESIEHAMEMAKEAIELYVESLQADATE